MVVWRPGPCDHPNLEHFLPTYQFVEHELSLELGKIFSFWDQTIEYLFNQKTQTI